MDLFLRNVPGLRDKISDKIIGIAGCGGLGSNIAVALTRTGIGSLVLVDFDRVEVSNLNRQYFFLNDVGKFKTTALKAHLKNINPDICITTENCKITPDNISRLYSQANILIEAFDKAEEKKMLIDYWSMSFPTKPLICGSGVAGVGKNDSLSTLKSGNLYICGDQKSDSNLEGLCSARVAIVANMQANLALELLFNSI